jgi:hypothetical protein
LVKEGGVSLVKKPIAVGSIFGALKVLEVVEIDGGDGVAPCTVYRCRCACGARKNIEGRRLRNGQAKSCGSCLRSLAVEEEPEVKQPKPRTCALASCRAAVPAGRKQSQGKVHCSAACSRTSKKLRENGLAEEWRRKNHATSIAYAAAYRARNRERLRLEAVAYYYTHREQILARKRGATLRPTGKPVLAGASAAQTRREA